MGLNHNSRSLLRARISDAVLGTMRGGGTVESSTAGELGYCGGGMGGSDGSLGDGGGGGGEGNDLPTSLIVVDVAAGNDGVVVGSAAVFPLGKAPFLLGGRILRWGGGGVGLLEAE